MGLTDSPPYCPLGVKYDIVVNCEMLRALAEGSHFLRPICRPPWVHTEGFEATASTASPASSRGWPYLAFVSVGCFITMTRHLSVCMRYKVSPGLRHLGMFCSLTTNVNEAHNLNWVLFNYLTPRNCLPLKEIVSRYNSIVFLIFLPLDVCQAADLFLFWPQYHSLVISWSWGAFKKFFSLISPIYCFA